MVVISGEAERGEHPMTVSNQFAVNMLKGNTCALGDFSKGGVHAVAGVGNPERFFAGLVAAGLDIQAHEFPDHYQYQREDVIFRDGLPVLMTEKDAVKCVRFSTPDFWCVPVSVELGNAFGQRLLMLLDKSKED